MMWKRIISKSSIAILSLCLITGMAYAEETQPIKWFDYGFNDGSVDTVYLSKSEKLTGGLGFTPITFVNDTFGIRVEYINELTGDMFDNDLIGFALQADIVKVVKLIPKAQWQLPNWDVKLSYGYLDNIEKFDFKDGEPSWILSVIKLF